MFLACAPAVAQNNIIRVDSILVKGGSITPSCRKAANTFIALAERFPRPSNWHFIIVCDQPTWSKFIQESGQKRHGVIVYGTTYLKDRVTYIDGYKLLHADTFAGAPTPARIVAHELAHVILHTNSDRKAEAQTKLWLKQAHIAVNQIAEAPPADHADR